MVHIDPKKLILFGAACSPVTDQIAKAAKHWNLVQVSVDQNYSRKRSFENIQSYSILTGNIFLLQTF